jgi:hypothetical protein
MTQDLRIWKDVLRGQAFEIEVDGVPVVAYEGETVAAALMAAGIRTTNKTARGQPRGICCGAPWDLLWHWPVLRLYDGH